MLFIEVRPIALRAMNWASRQTPDFRLPLLKNFRLKLGATVLTPISFRHHGSLLGLEYDRRNFTVRSLAISSESCLRAARVR